ncbi:MAG: histidinol-phosphatase [Acetivibrio sp.]
MIYCTEILWEKGSAVLKNFHTHTYRCKHAEGDVSDYIKMAKIKNITEIGFSDHTPLPDNWWLDVRMGMKELPGYVKAVEEAKENYKDLRILLGLECDYSPEYQGYFEKIKEEYAMDYLIGSIHAFPYKGERIGCFTDEKFNNEKLKAYGESYVKAMESGLFTFMAHPDLFCLSLSNWNPEAIAMSVYILEAAKALDMPLEINCSGIRKSMEKGKLEIAYPRREFWELAGYYGVKGIVNSDAHAPKDLTENMDAGFFIQKEYGIENFEL